MTTIERIQALLNKTDKKDFVLEKEIGLAQGSLKNWRANKSKPSADALTKIADFYNVSIDFLLGRDIKEIDYDKYGFFKIEDTSLIPVLGRIVAGIPLISEQNIEEYIYISQKPSEDYFGLRVFGDSMVGAGIIDGSILIVKKQSTAENGQIVVALINGDEATVKRYKCVGNQHILMPENTNYDPIIMNGKNQAQIIGVVVEVRIKL